MKIIDFSRKGNVIRFYLGCSKDYCGDDWDDAPYEHNASQVYDEYIEEYIDLMVQYDYLVLEPSDTPEYNSQWSKDDMKARRVPCILIVPGNIRNECISDSFDYWVNSAEVIKIYFGDKIESIPQITNEHDNIYTMIKSK